MRSASPYKNMERNQSTFDSYVRVPCMRNQFVCSYSAVFLFARLYFI